MSRDLHQLVRDGSILTKSGVRTYEALAQEAFSSNHKLQPVERERLSRSKRRLPMAPAGIMRIRGKR